MTSEEEKKQIETDKIMDSEPKELKTCPVCGHKQHDHTTDESCEEEDCYCGVSFW